MPKISNMVRFSRNKTLAELEDAVERNKHGKEQTQEIVDSFLTWGGMVWGVKGSSIWLEVENRQSGRVFRVLIDKTLVEARK